MKYYLAYHVKNPRDVRLELPMKIHEMVEYITKELEAGNHLQDRNILLEVCAGVACTCQDILDLLWIAESLSSSRKWFGLKNHWRQDRSQSISPNSTLDEKFIAAICVHAYWLVAELLPHAPEHLPESVWERPISAAVLLEDSDMVKLIIESMDEEKSKKWQRNEMLDDTSIYSTEGAVSNSIANNNTDITAFLLGYLDGYTALINKPYYCKWVKLAVNCQNNESLKSLLQIAAEESPYHICNRTFEQGCRTGSLAIVKTLLEYGQVELESFSTTLSAMASSIRSGTVEMVREVVAAGADINYVLTHHRSVKIDTFTPLEYAVHLRKLDVVAYLVECGANIPHQCFWPSRGEIRKVLQKAVEERAAT
ncbi:hypothetical protein ACET3X_004479 [Alternaria dauci]|uniref:Ankyrin repeat protein n=1 Tax=Alternaria dauci TaxID=48095 RepID=A0ABR3UN57_9PLEO